MTSAWCSPRTGAIATGEQTRRNCRWTAIILAFGPFAQLVKAAGVKRITLHGLRHTCATLLIAAGVPVNVVFARLGHAKTSITTDMYAHVLPGAQQEAAAILGALLAAKSS